MATNGSGTNGSGGPPRFDPWINEPPPAGLGDEKPAIVVTLDDDGENPVDSNIDIELEDGSLVVNLSSSAPKKDMAGAKPHDANLAEFIADAELARISDELLDGIDADLQSRTEWITRRANGIKHLALVIENPRSPSADADTAVEGQSTVRSPVMLDAVLRFQANARGELLPSGGPAKFRNDTVTLTQAGQAAATAAGFPPSNDGDVLSEALEKDFNRYLTVTDKEYYPDTNRMFFMLGFGGSSFKKVYRCPLKRRPVARAIDASGVIVSDNEVSLHDCGRVTHRSEMRQSVLKRMQLAGVYRKLDLQTPQPKQEDELEAAERNVAGIGQAWSQRPADYKHTIYESYCELDIEGFEHKEEGKVTGLPLPYRVTIDKDSQEVLEVKRNWKEEDKQFNKLMPIVKYPFVDGLGFYGIGLLNLMGNATAAITTAWRLALDCAAFGSWPGFLYSETVARQDTQEFRIGLGAGRKVNTGGQRLSDHVMAIPYKDATAGLFQMMGKMEEEARRVGGTPELMVGEGRADVPVGTTLAMIDQAVKVIDSVHKGLHIAQAEELGLLRDLFIEDPQSLICSNPKPARKWEMDELVRALRDCNLTPQSDPNTPSHTIRVMKAVALVQMVQMKPDEFDFRKVANRVSAMVGMGDLNDLYAPPKNDALPPDPKVMGEMLKFRSKMAELAQNKEMFQAEEMGKMMKMELEKLKAFLTADDHEKQRQSQERIADSKMNLERMNLAEGALVHQDAIPAAQQFAGSWPPRGLAPPTRVL